MSNLRPTLVSALKDDRTAREMGRDPKRAASKTNFRYFTGLCLSPWLSQSSTRSYRPSPWVMSRPHHFRRTS